MRHVREVGGFDLMSTPRASVLDVQRYPMVAPYFGDKHGRIRPPASDVVVISLYDLFSWKTGAVKFSSRDELLRRFLFADDTRITVT